MNHTLKTIIFITFIMNIFLQYVTADDGDKKTCEKWINAEEGITSVWKSGYYKFRDIHGKQITPAIFCNKFGVNLPETEQIRHDWILFNGYYENDIKKNIQLAETRDLNCLDSYISDWPFMYGKFLIETKEELTPEQYCRDHLMITGLVTSEFYDQESLIKKYFGYKMIHYPRARWFE